MKLIENWKEVLEGAWSVKLASLSAIFSALQQFAMSIPGELAGSVAGVLGAVAGVFAASVVVARVIDQGLSK